MSQKYFTSVAFEFKKKIPHYHRNFFDAFTHKSNILCLKFLDKYLHCWNTWDLQPSSNWRCSMFFTLAPDWCVDVDFYHATLPFGNPINVELCVSFPLFKLIKIIITILFGYGSWTFAWKFLVLILSYLMFMLFAKEEGKN